MTLETVRWFVLAAGIGLGSAALAEGLPRLPGELTMPQGEDSPGKVTFRHDSHVDSAKPGCVTCHPRAFSILGRSSDRVREKITHDAMEKGKACGSCHGKQAFGFDECGNCHAE
jgi:c(7)-type cytochrome triheme protein